MRVCSECREIVLSRRDKVMVLLTSPLWIVPFIAYLVVMLLVYVPGGGALTFLAWREGGEGKWQDRKRRWMDV